MPADAANTIMLNAQYHPQNENRTKSNVSVTGLCDNRSALGTRCECYHVTDNHLTVSYALTSCRAAMLRTGSMIPKRAMVAASASYRLMKDGSAVAVVVRAQSSDHGIHAKQLPR